MLVVKNAPHNTGNIRKAGSILGQEDPLEEGMATSAVFLPEADHGQRSLEACSPRGHKELDPTGVP